MQRLDAPPLIFDRALIRRRRAAALRSPRFPDFLIAAAAQEMAERLSVILRRFDTALVLGAAAGPLSQLLELSDKFDRLIRADLVAQGPVGAVDVILDEEALPFAPESLDAVIAGPGLEGLNDLPGALVQMRRALKPDGLLLAVLLGGETLSELRQAWLMAESELSGGVTPRVAPFADVRDLGSLLQRAGFALPVVDADRLTVRYPDAISLMRELKAMGLANPLSSRSRKPVDRNLLLRAASTYDDTFADPDGRVRATFELITLTGWAPAETQQKPLKPGSARARLADALGTTEHKVRR